MSSKLSEARVVGGGPNAHFWFSVSVARCEGSRYRAPDSPGSASLHPRLYSAARCAGSACSQLMRAADSINTVFPTTIRAAAYSFDKYGI